MFAATYIPQPGDGYDPETGLFYSPSLSYAEFIAPDSLVGLPPATEEEPDAAADVALVEAAMPSVVKDGNGAPPDVPAITLAVSESSAAYIPDSPNAEPFPVVAADP